jgi:tetratricopeptide (TPR) repeat protein
MASEDFGSLESLQVLLQQNPNSLTFGRVADALLKRGRVDEAIQLCEDGLRKHPAYVTGHMVLGKCYLKKKLFDQAEKEFKRVLLFDPRYLAAHKYYGDLMREIGWDNTCEMSYRKILQIDPLDNGVRAVIEELAQKAKMEKIEPAPIRRTAVEPPPSTATITIPPVMPVATPMPADDFYSMNGADENDLLRYQPATAAEDDGILQDDFAPPSEVPSAAALDAGMPPANDEERFSYILDDIFQDEVLDDAAGKNAMPANRRDEEEKRRPDEANRDFGEDVDGAAQSLRATSRIPTRPVNFDLELDGDPTTIAAAPKSAGLNLDAVNRDENNASPRPNSRSTNSTRLPARRPKILDDHGDDLTATVSASEREKIVTPTLGEIYAAQGQYTKAIGVFELLSRKEPNNKHYRDKIDYLKKRLQETQNAG